MCFKEMREKEKQLMQQKELKALHKGMKRALGIPAYRSVKHNHLHNEEHKYDGGDDGYESDGFTSSYRTNNKKKKPKKVEVDQNLPSFDSSLLDIIEAEEKKKYEEHKLRTRIGRRIDISTADSSVKTFNRGDARLAKLRWLLDNFGVRRSVEQKQFHEAYIRACLPWIYGDEFEANYARIMQENAIKKLIQNVLGLAPRRFGKTWAIAMFVAAMLLVVTGIEISIFSTGKRASGSLTERVKMFMLQIPGSSEAYERICKETQEDLFVAAAPLSGQQGKKGTEASKARSLISTSKLHSLPGGSTGEHTDIHISINIIIMIIIKALTANGWDQKVTPLRTICFHLIYQIQHFFPSVRVCYFTFCPL